MKLFIVDDHPLILEGYISSFRRTGEISIVYETTYLKCVDLIRKGGFSFDVVLLDLVLDGSGEKSKPEGVELALEIREKYPETKIILITSLIDKISIYEFNRAVRPDGFVVKNECHPSDIVDCVQTVGEGGTYYSNSVRSAIKAMSEYEVFFDNINRQIIFLISQGVKTKNLPSHLPLSLSAIDKRKASIKIALSIEKGSDEDIIREAKKNGLI